MNDILWWREHASGTHHAHRSMAFDIDDRSVCGRTSASKRHADVDLRDAGLRRCARCMDYAMANDTESEDE